MRMGSMEKEKQLEPKLLRREVFCVKCPKRIVVGDPYYFETVPPERLKKLVADYTLPKSYEARLVLSQYEMHDFGVCRNNISSAEYVSTNRRERVFRYCN